MKTEKEKVNIGTPVRDEMLEGAKEKPVKAKTIYQIKCIWSGPVNIQAKDTPSGTAYSFQPGQVQEVTSRADALYLASIGQDKPGCCSGSGTPRIYFELA